LTFLWISGNIRLPDERIGAEIAGVVQLVEHLLAKEKVVGSSPITRSLFQKMATWPSGKARVCKTLITGSNPVVASSVKAGLRTCFFNSP